jgi:hypothetical protein
MTITLHIEPEIKAELARQAATQGCAVEVYAASLLEMAVAQVFDKEIENSKAAKMPELTGIYRRQT